MKILFPLLFFIASPAILSAQAGQQVPILKMEGRIIDLANLFTAEQKKSLFILTEDLENKVGSQIGIITVETLYGQSINDYSRNQANRMGLGRKKIKDGLLIVFSQRDGLLRTEVGQGLDKIITNQVSTLINETVMAPQLRQGNYAEAFNNGIKALSERIIADQGLIGK